MKIKTVEKVALKYIIIGIMSSIALVISSLLYILLAFYLGKIVEASLDLDMLSFKKGVIIALGIITFSGVCNYMGQVLRKKFSVKATLLYKQKIIDKILGFSYTKYNQSHQSYYLNMMTEETYVIQEHYFMQFSAIVQNFSQIIFGIMALVYISWKFTLAVFGLFFLPLLVPVFIGPILSRRRMSVNSIHESYIVTLKGILEGFELIRTYGLLNIIREQFKSANTKLENTRYHFSKVDFLKDILSNSLTAISQMGAIAIGVALIFDGQMTVPILFAAVQIINAIINPIDDLSQRLSWIVGTKLVREKHERMLSSQNTENINGTIINNINNIVIENLTFSYENQLVFDKLSFRFEKGKKYAIIGESGSGKSTLLKLLLGHYGNYEGDILYDDLNQRSIDLSSLHRNISSIHQNTFLFEDTLKNNIELYKEHTKSDYDSAIIKSNLMTLNKLVGETILVDNGSKLSGGEKQRIAIARCLINKSDIILVDEATSSLDSENAYLFFNSILELNGVLCIVVTHNDNPEILKRFDCVLRVKDYKLEIVNEI
ncbi:ATP-binding cassette domain-containing protein [Fusibacter tunisiensis]|uniref:ATP-binding cassette subfamily C protein n=1 Tax=Fusibacter tunisiensis TaxID=1008308 RepID=A0ABS2MT79_9FIRM|nr:ABC transporter ATP-binding protein [Fusibacter tunisiensis]MBM7562626.1 ATP-binding cassette subfamily C protein [Fusibacter tunisiensis]